MYVGSFKSIVIGQKVSFESGPFRWIGLITQLGTCMEKYPLFCYNCVEKIKKITAAQIKRFCNMVILLHTHSLPKF